MVNQAKKKVGQVVKVIPGKSICFIRCDDETQYFSHERYFVKRKLEPVGQLVRFTPVEVGDDSVNDRAINVEAIQ